MKRFLIGWSILGLVILLGLAYFLTQRLSPRSQFVSSPNDSVAPVETPSIPVTTTKFLFGGDLMFDRTIRQRMATGGIDLPLKALQPTFDEYDVIVANLEGPITDNPSRSVGSVPGSTNNFIFTFQPEVAPMLAKTKFSIVNLGNNHILNMGEYGVFETKTYLSMAGIKFFGDTSTETNIDDRILRYTINGLTTAFINYNEFVPNGYETTLADIEYAKDKSDFIVIYTHWGAEYQPVANQVIQDQAHAFIDAGADLIMGSHPHVVQQVEEYQGKKIYYSLGNFVFDQYFSSETKSGLLVGVELDADGFKNFVEIPIVMENTGQTKLR